MVAAPKAAPPHGDCGKCRAIIRQMHRLPNRQAVRRVRSLAWLLLGNRLLAPLSVVALLCALLAGDGELIRFALGLLGAAVVLRIAEWLGATRSRCPLCLGPPLAHIACVKHRDARRLLGSYRLQVVRSIIMEGEYRCPYCGEFTSIAVRRHHRHRHGHPHH